MNSFDFKEQLAMSSGTSVSEDVGAILLENIPGATRILKSTTQEDRNGTDWWAEHVRGTPISIDCKVRSTDPIQKFNRDDLALETLSVVEENKIGWTLDPKKRTDYILWWFKPTKRWVLVPFLQLVHSFSKRVDEWSEMYKSWRQESRSGSRIWHSEMLLVPRREVWAAIFRDFGGSPVSNDSNAERALVGTRPTHATSRHGVVEQLTPCEVCGQQRPIMLAMEPGKDGIEWRLCSQCWRTERTPTVNVRHLGKTPKAKIADSLAFDRERK